MTLHDVWRLWRAHWKLLVACVLLGLAAAAAWSATRPVIYSSTSTAYVVAGDSGTMGDAFSGASLAKERAAAYVPLVSSLPVGERVVKDLGIDLSPAAVASALSAQTTPDSYIFKVTARAEGATLARDLADAGMRALVDEAFRLENAGRPEGQKQSSVVKVVPIEQAVLPAAPVSPDWPQNLAIGAAAGALLGALFVVSRRQLDRRARTKADVTSALGASVLGILPVSKELDRTTRGIAMEPQGPASEALRQLRTNLRYANLDHPPRSILVTSASAGEGKSTVSSNLARVIAATGQPVVLIDADLRRPTVATTFGVDDAVGLTQVLAEEVTLEDALQTTDQPNLLLLTAGRLPPNPSEIVGSTRMHTFLDELVASGLMVVLDAPPLLPVTDAGLLSVIADGTLVVVATGHADKEELAHTREVLDQVGGHLLGAVMNRAPLKEMGSVHYGYGYRSKKQSTYATSSYGKDAKKKARQARKRRSRGAQPVG